MTRSLSLAALLVLTLRAAPAVVAALAPEPAGEARIPVGYVPKDFLQYVAFIRQAEETGAWWLANPFTTAPQAGRFLVLFLAAIGHLCRWTGLDPFVALEVARVPVYAFFFAALGAFVREALPDPASRRWAVWLVALSGGFGYLARLVLPLLPQGMADAVALSLWNAYGWSTFEALYNPMWALGLGLALVVFRSCLRPDGPRGGADVARTSGAFAAAYACHAYTAIVVLAVLAVRWIRDLASGGAGSVRARRLALTVAPGLAVAGAAVLYQIADPAFRSGAGGVLGSQLVSLLWYPLGLGAAGLFAWIGFRRRRHEPWAIEIAAWAATVAVLHNLPFVNGYHFLFHLHLPLALLAAPAAAAAFRAARTGAGRALILAALFLSSAAVTAEAVAEAVRFHLVPGSWIAAARSLAGHPPGHVLAPQPVGNLIPAWAAHRVWVGHWFLSPDARERARRVERLFAAPRAEAEALRKLVRQERIRYLVVPAGTADAVAAVLGKHGIERESVDGLVVLVLGE